MGGGKVGGVKGGRCTRGCQGRVAAGAGGGGGAKECYRGHDNSGYQGMGTGGADRSGPCEVWLLDNAAGTKINWWY